MLIPGLLLYLIDFYRRASQQEASSHAIDHDLDQLHKLQAMKMRPVTDRPMNLTDEQIDALIERVKTIASQRPAYKDIARGMLHRLEQEWQRVFPPEYWQDWLRRMVKVS
jgi:hypothetical protein